MCDCEPVVKPEVQRQFKLIPITECASQRGIFWGTQSTFRDGATVLQLRVLARDNKPGRTVGGEMTRKAQREA